jgi:peptidyl-prolyl cis-trans isomerase D
MSKNISIALQPSNPLSFFSSVWTEPFCRTEDRTLFEGELMALDVMRRQKKLLMGLLLAPLILGLVAYLIPGLPGGVWGTGVDSAALATVGKVDIPAATFKNQYQRFLRNNRLPNDRQFLRTLQIEQQILKQLIDKELISAEARRLGIDATANEIQQKVLSLPYFVENGNFLFNRYEAILRQNGMTVQEFEDGIRTDIIREKLRNLITDTTLVSDKEVEADYRNRNEKVKVSYVSFEPGPFTNSVTASEGDLKAYYEKNKENYRVPEQRKLKYLLADTAKLRDAIQISDNELRSYYQQNLSNYQLPEMVRAAHILFKTEGKSPEEVEKIRAKATQVLLQAKAGEDFAGLARKYSEDTSSTNGGDLGLFRRGQMVPPFENAAFSLGVGAISDLVTTNFGFHIIKVLQKQPSHTQKFEEVVSLIKPSLQQRKAEQAAQELADKAFSRLKSNQTFDQVSKELALRIQETSLFSQGSSIPGIGNSPDLSSKAFSLKVKEFASPVRVPSGFVVPQVVEIQAPRLPGMAEVRTKLEQDFKSFKAGDIAKAKADEFANQLKSGANIEKLAKTYGVTVKNSEDFSRNGTIADLGPSAPVESFAFSANLGDTSQPVQIGQKYVVLQLKAKTPIDPQEFAKAKEGLRESLLSQRKEQVFQAYLDGIRSGMQKAGKIRINDVLLAEISRRF